MNLLKYIEKLRKSKEKLIKLYIEKPKKILI